MRPVAKPLMEEKVNWAYHSEPDPNMDGRRMYCPRGRVVGGSSSINGLVYIRGNAFDFEHWREQGAAGWGYADVLPYFIKAETRAEGPTAYRGGEGKLATSYGTLQNPLHAAWLEAAQQAGYALTDDINGFRQEGFGRMDMTVGGGIRCSAANAYLRPAMKRPNLRVVTKARATRVVCAGRRATGVVFERGGRQHLAAAPH